MDEVRGIADLVAFSRALYERRLVHASGGNTSIRAGDNIWITKTGAVLGDLSEADLSKVSLEGEVLAGDKPSKELGMHLAYYHAREDAQAIIHVHPTFAIAYSTILTEPTSKDAIPAYTAALYVRAGKVPMVDYYPSGSEELHHAVAVVAPYFPAVLLKQHGVTVASKDMSTAMGMLEEIEQCCHIALLTGQIGNPITEDQKAAIDLKMGRSWIS